MISGPAAVLLLLGHYALDGGINFLLPRLEERIRGIFFQVAMIVFMLGNLFDFNAIQFEFYMQYQTYTI